MADLANILESFDVQRVSATAHEDTYRAQHANLNLPRAFGGQLLAQALMAAGRTVDGSRSPHSLHAYFLRPGDPEGELTLRVERVRDGRSASVRQVRVEQHGRAITLATLSFATLGNGPVHQTHLPPHAGPASVPEMKDAALAWGGLSAIWRPFEAFEIRLAPMLVRPDEVPLASAGDTVWQRGRGNVPDDPLLHYALLTFTSDLTLLAAGKVPYGVRVGEGDSDDMSLNATSLDHALWFHRRPRMNNWVRVEQHSSVGAFGRALMHSETFDEDGLMIASAVQEGRLSAGSLAPPANRNTTSFLHAEAHNQEARRAVPADRP